MRRTHSRLALILHVLLVRAINTIVHIHFRRGAWSSNKEIGDTILQGNKDNERILKGQVPSFHLPSTADVDFDDGAQSAARRLFRTRRILLINRGTALGVVAKDFGC